MGFVRLKKPDETEFYANAIDQMSVSHRADLNVLDQVRPPLFY